MDPFCKDRQVTIHCHLTEDKIRGSSSMLREMAMNLIDNGVKYNRPGGHVYVTMGRDGDQVVLTVKDTGIGIPEDVQERVSNGSTGWKGAGASKAAAAVWACPS